MRTVTMTLLQVAIGSILFLGTKQAMADFQINDPNGTLAEMKRDSRAGSLPFSQALTCGESRKFTATDARCEYRCTTMFCQSRCETALDYFAKFDLHVEECTADSASIFGDNGWAFAVDRAEYEADGTWVRALLRNAGLYIQPEGTWTIDHMWWANADIIEGGRRVALSNVRELKVTLSFAEGAQEQSFFILIDMDKAGLDQLLAFGNGLFPTPDAPMFFIRRGLIIPNRGGPL